MRFLNASKNTIDTNLLLIYGTMTELHRQSVLVFAVTGNYDLIQITLILLYQPPFCPQSQLNP